MRRSLASITPRMKAASSRIPVACRFGTNRRYESGLRACRTGALAMKDLSIALQDRPGSLAEMGEVLGRAGVSIEGGGAWVMNGQGVAHFLFHDGHAARRALEAGGIQVLEERDVVVQRLDQETPRPVGCARAQDGGRGRQHRGLVQRPRAPIDPGRGRGHAFPSGPRPDRPRAETVPDGLHRESEPRPFVLGQLRPAGYIY